MDGVVTQLRCTEGRAVLAAQTLVIIRADIGHAVAEARSLTLGDRQC